jgi:hypothetical protein
MWMPRCFGGLELGPVDLGIEGLGAVERQTATEVV